MPADPNSYDNDVMAWADEQARLLRAGCFDALDIAHIADEIEDVGKSEQRELASRMAVLLAHLLKWQLQPTRRGASWEITVRNQRSNPVRTRLCVRPQGWPCPKSVIALLETCSTNWSGIR